MGGAGVPCAICGPGGGSIQLTVPGDVVLGAGANISADAGPCALTYGTDNLCGSGGAGGSILIVAGRLLGSGSLSASAYQGSQGCACSAGGGGGRVALYAQSVSAQIGVRVASQCGAGAGAGYALSHGGPGTIYRNTTDTMVYVGHQCYGRAGQLDVPGLAAAVTPRHRPVLGLPCPS